MAEDIQRYLNDEAVVACPPSAAYRFRKFARRNRGALTTGTIIFVALAMGIVGTAWQARQAVLSRDRALQAEDRAVKAEDRAVKNLERALSTVDKMLTRVADEKLANVPFMGEVRRGLLEDALTIYQQLLASAGNEPATGLETAMAQRRLATILVHLGRTSQAEESTQAAVELLTTMLKQAPNDSQLGFELARIQKLQSEIDKDNLESSIAHLEQAVKILDRLSKGDNAIREANVELAFCLSVLADKLQDAGERSPSQEAFQRAEHVYTELLDGVSADGDLMVSYAKHIVNWGGCLLDVEDWEAAEGKFRKAADIGLSLLKLDQRDAQSRLVYAVALGNVGNALFRQGKLQEADSMNRDTIESLRPLVRDYPSFPNYRLRLSGYLMAAGGMCSEMGELQRGISYTEEAVELLKYLTDNWPTVREYQRVSGAALNNLALLMRQQGEDLEKAEQLLERAIEHQRRAIEDPENPNLYLVRHYLLLAQIQMQRGRVQEALTTCDEGLEVAEKLSKRLPENETVSRIRDDLRKIKQEGAVSAGSEDPP